MTDPFIPPSVAAYAGTDRQREIVKAVNDNGGNQAAAARALGISNGNVSDVVRLVRARAAAQGVAPEAGLTDPAIPEPFVAKGHSTLRRYRDGESEVLLRWEKTKLDDQLRAELIRKGLEAACEAIPRLAPLPRPPACASTLANLYTFTDYHLGMFAWAAETGADWNIEIAEATLVAALEHMVTRAPRAALGILNIQGDFLHFDSLMPVTPTHGHVLDAAGRASQIVAAAIRVLRRLIDLLLMHHGEVEVIIAEGNHDIFSSLMLRHLFGALYEGESRVSVNASEVPYYVRQWGRVMLAFHHGHLKKNESLAEFFAAAFSEMWGATRHRYCHTGHRHHEQLIERAGMKIRQHPTLAAPDAHAARGGWLSMRQASAETYHAERGKVAEIVVTPEMLDLDLAA